MDLSGHRVVAARTERGAAGDAAHREPAAAQGAVLLHGVGGVLGAGRRVAAGARRMRRQELLVHPDQAEGGPGEQAHDPASSRSAPAEASTRSTSATSSAWLVVTAVR